jgi:ribosome-associated protein
MEKSPGKSVKKDAKETTKKTAGRSSSTSKDKVTKKSVKKAVKKAATGRTKNAVTPEEKDEQERGRQLPAKKAATQKLPSVEAGYRRPSEDPAMRRLVEDLVAFLDEKKLTDIKVMNLEDVNPYFCFFIIATAGSSLQLGTTAREISRRFGEHLINKKIRPLDVESGWVIHDFVDVVLHLFLQEQRNYYNLEKLWGDASIIYSAEAPRFQWPRSDRKTAE